MSKLDELYALERDAERPAGPQWFPDLVLDDPNVPYAVLAHGVTIWRVATSAPASYAQLFATMGHHFIVSDDNADLHRYVLEHWRRSEAD